MTSLATEQIKRPEVIQDIATAIESAIIEHGTLGGQDAADISLLAADIVWERFAGEQVYVQQQISKIHREIYNRLCRPHATLEGVAKDYGYTVRYIRIIYKQMAVAENNRLQPGLFE